MCKEDCRTAIGPTLTSAAVVLHPTCKAWRVARRSIYNHQPQQQYHAGGAPFASGRALCPMPQGGTGLGHAQPPTTTTVSRGGGAFRERVELSLKDRVKLVRLVRTP